MNREQWLTDLIELLRADFIEAGFPIPAKIRASCSWPSKFASRGKVQRVGEAWQHDDKDGNCFEIFISPVLGNSAIVAATLVHELCHCAAGIISEHRLPFRMCANRIGLIGKYNATIAGRFLAGRLSVMIEKLGSYPHSEITSPRPSHQRIAPPRISKAICSHCGYSVSIPKKWLFVGPPTCPCGILMTIESKASELGKAS